MRSKKYLSLNIETISDTLKRMEVEADSFHTLDELIEFFSRKGRPNYIWRRIKQ